jgi:hypothetical protein
MAQIVRSVNVPRPQSLDISSPAIGHARLSAIAMHQASDFPGMFSILRRSNVLCRS